MLRDIHSKSHKFINIQISIIKGPSKASHSTLHPLPHNLKITIFKLNLLHLPLAVKLTGLLNEWRANLP